ncbi:MAG: hypothetical protein EA418_07540 [Wenzhouxiangellaceae bacterium]|nr:MAG: hypothetical protein EA418_07540 [Wenzhouxiangellaceae bacterium]
MKDVLLEAGHQHRWRFSFEALDQPVQMVVQNHVRKMSMSMLTLDLSQTPEQVRFVSLMTQPRAAAGRHQGEEDHIVVFEVASIAGHEHRMKSPPWPSESETGAICLEKSALVSIRILRLFRNISDGFQAAAIGGLIRLLAFCLCQSPRGIMKRLRSSHSHSIRHPTMRYEFAKLVFDADSGRLARQGGKGVSLRPQVARLLQVFLDHPDQVLDRETLCKAVWDEGTVIDFESGLAAVLRELRRALTGQGADDDLIETIPRRGCRLTLAADQVQRVEHSPPLNRSQVRRGIWGGAAFGAVVLLIFSLFWPGGSAPPPPESEPQPQRHALAILPFEHLAGTEPEPPYSGILLADYLLTELWREGLQETDLIGRTSLLAFEERSDVAAAAAAELGVDLLVEGSISRDEDAWRITARLLQIPPGTVRWSMQISVPTDGPLPLSELAEQLAEGMRTDWSARAE